MAAHTAGPESADRSPAAGAPDATNSAGVRPANRRHSRVRCA